MSELTVLNESIITLFSIPHPDSLFLLNAKIDVEEKRDNSTRSAFHWQLLKCRYVYHFYILVSCLLYFNGNIVLRLLIFSLEEILACPSMQTLFEIHIVIRKIDYENGRLQTLIGKLNMKVCAFILYI